MSGKELEPQPHGGALKRDAGPGRPRGAPVMKYVKRILTENNCNKARRLAEALVERAMEGNGVAIKQILDRIDGPVTERIESSGVTKVIIERVQIADSSPSLGATGDIEAEEEI